MLFFEFLFPAISNPFPSGASCPNDSSQETGRRRTLSQWLRDYLYIPLGGNRGSSLATYRNLMLTMLLGGLWHGASWNFVLWGGLHGAYLAVERALHSLVPRPPTALRIFGVYLLVVWAWVPFRLPTLLHTWTWWEGMMGLRGLGTVAWEPALAAVLSLLLVWAPRSDEPPIVEWKLAPSVGLVLLFLAALFVGYGRVEESPFLYFRF